MKIGRLPYLNVYPLYEELMPRLAPFRSEFTVAPPLELARRFAAGVLEVTPVSAGTLPDLRGALVLPGACIAADGPVRSVMLFSDRPIGELGGVRVLHGVDSVASVRLFRAFALHRYGFEAEVAPDVERFHAAPGFTAPVLLIGDACLRYNLASVHPYRYDLAEEWKALTGLPMVFALFVVNERLANERPADVAALAGHLSVAAVDAKRKSADHARTAAEVSGFSEPLLADYFRCLDWELDDRKRAGLAKYYEMIGNSMSNFMPRFSGATS